MSNSRLELRAATKSYVLGRSTIPVLSQVSASFLAAEFHSITGASGSGKTTLLQLLGGLDHPQEGQVCWDGEPLSVMSRHRLAQWRGEKIGFVFQSYHLLPELTAAENVALPWRLRRKNAGSRAEDWLKKVGLADRRHHRPNELSGGERQRVAVARAMAQEPALILADEPTGNLDRTTGTTIMELLLSLRQEQGCGLILVTHDPIWAERGEKRWHLAEGKLVQVGGF